MAWLLEKFYLCDMSTLPTSILIHRFWHQFLVSGDMTTSANYIRCMTHHKVIFNGGVTHERCRKLLIDVCPKRYSPGARNLEKCRSVLWNNGKWKSSESEIRKHFDSKTTKKFMDYFQCIDKYELPARTCAKKELDDRCVTKKVRVVKTVRATFDVTKVILDKYHNSKVIHLMRDPRGAARSRKLAQWSWGLKEGKEAKDRAEKYCVRATDDNQKRMMFNEEHPGRSMRLIYDEMVNNVTRYATEVYQFLNIPMAKQTVDFVFQNTQDKEIKLKTTEYPGSTNTTVEKYTSRAEKWKYFFTATEIQNIREVCKDFYEQVKYTWA